MDSAVKADRLKDVQRAMGQSVSASTGVLEVLSWSTILNKGVGEDSDEALPTGKRDDTDGNIDVLGPTDHVEFLDETVEASTKSLKIPTAKVTDLSKRTVKGVVTRTMCVGAHKISIGFLDWAGVLAVMTGKTPKAVVNGEWSFGKAGSEDVVRIRHLKSVLTGEISVRALTKLV